MLAQALPLFTAQTGTAVATKGQGKALTAPKAKRVAQPAAAFPCTGEVLAMSNDNGNGTGQLYMGDGNGQGNIPFAPLGPPSATQYNGMGMHPTEHIIYAIGAVQGDPLLSIDATGAVTNLGSVGLPNSGPAVYVTGGFTPDGAYYVMDIESNPNVMYRVDVAAKTSTPVPLSAAAPTADITYSGGYFWGDLDSSNQMVRIDPATGQVDKFPGFGLGRTGATFTYGNGDIGIITNANGDVHRISVADINNPTEVSVTSSPITGPEIDATSCFGAVEPSPSPTPTPTATPTPTPTATPSPDPSVTPTPLAQVDLAVDKSGPASANEGDQVAYTIKVTNNGPANSTGYTLTDPIPPGLLNPATSTPGCTIAGGVLTCTGGALAAGASTNIILTGTAGPGITKITNTTTVTGNEPDPVPGNNTDTVETPLTPKPTEVDLAVDKTGPASAQVGDPIAYTIKVTNNGPAASSGYTLTDQIPTGLLNPATSTPGCTIAGGVLTCTGGPLAAGGSTNIILTGTAGPGITKITNTVIVDGNEPDPNPGNDTDTFETPITPKPVPQVDLAVDKSGPANAVVGDPVTYTIKVTNNGPANSTGYTLTDPIPAGLLNAATTTPGCTVIAGVLTCTGGPLAAGASTNIILTGTAGPGVTKITNTVTVDGNETDPVPANDTDTFETPLTPKPVPQVDLAVDKSGPVNAKAGDPIAYTIKVTNNGPADSTGYTLTDQIPTGLLNAATSTPGCTIAGGVLTCTGGALTAGSSTNIILTGTAGPGVTKITNTATVDGNETDPVPENDTDTVETPVTPTQVDLAVDKSGPASANEGDPVTYTIKVTNNGPSNSTGYTLTDQIPTGLLNAATSSPGCTITAGVLTCTGGPLAAGSSTNIILTGTAGPGITKITNTAIVDGNEPDPVPANDTDTVETPVNPKPTDVDLAVDKSGPASANEGAPVTYTIKVTNNGPAASTGYTLTDQIPAGLLNASTSSPGCTITAGVLTCNGGPLAAGASRNITLTGTAGPGITKITNTVTVDGNEPDPDPGNDTDTVETPVDPTEVDLAVDKSGPASANEGAPVTYTIKVTNNGPSNSSGYTLTDQIPAGLLNAATSTPGCTIAGGVLTCNGGPLAAGASRNITLTGTAGPGITKITNTVTVDGNEPDPDPGNDTDTVETPVDPTEVDLAVDKSGPASANEGAPVTYTIKVTNNGPSNSSGYTITDPIPFGLLNASTSTPGCTVSGGVLTCLGGPLAAGASRNITLTGIVGPGFTKIRNSVEVDGFEPDPVPENDTDTVETPVDPTEVDLAVDKTGPASASEGAPVTYTIKVTNNGPSNSSGYTLTDQIPAGLLNAATSSPGCTITAGVLTCNGGPLAAGASRNITLTGTAGPGITKITNTVTVDGNDPDPDPGNDTDTTETPVTPTQVDLAVDKTGPASVKAGDPVTYTIKVTNNGPSNSKGYTLTDQIPTGLLNAATSSPGCTIAGGVLTCNGGPLAAGESRNITLTGTAGPGITKITNTVTVDGNDPDPDPDNDTDTTETPVTPTQVDLAVDKTGPASAKAGDPVTYTIKVTNNGPSNSSGYTLTDQIPAGLLNAATSSPGCTIAGGVLTCNGGPLAAGESRNITLTGTAGPGITKIINTVTVDGNEPDPDPGDDTDTTETPITPVNVDLSVDKSGPASVKAGDPVTYTIKVTNNGPSNSSGYTLTDQIPAGLLNAATSSPGCTITAGVLTCAGGPLAAGESRNVTLTGTAGPGITSLTNTVTVDGKDPDDDPGNDTDTTETPVTPTKADLSVDKSGPASVKAGDPVTYTIKVTNNGPSNSSGYTLTDQIPTGLLNASTSSPGCTIAGGVLTCNGGPLAAGASRNITLTGTAGPGITSLTNTVTVDGNDPDDDPGNDTDTTETPVTP
ncbi:DUF6923 family protein, partial [Streptomyces sp. NPDC087297]|uniref:DUF6923 family protein n=1 Tax=Streptomyces sp. NPDC087297 TaxID=3365778 RepID=UPI003815A98B